MKGGGLLTFRSENRIHEDGNFLVTDACTVGYQVSSIATSAAGVDICCGASSVVVSMLSTLDVS